jgi:ACS family hexuronate transporter-like MFS transporter
MDVGAARGSAWKWGVCGLLLLATMLNYMDRMTLNQTAKQVKDHFELSNRQYGRLESAFALAFATGAILGGLMVDRWNVWWIYPSAVLGWSAAGFVTGFVRDYEELVACRFCLGLAEAIHWPCALRTTQRILAPAQRTMGNSILQSGAAIGAILTPLVVLFFLAQTGGWRAPFWAIGGLGVFWVILWLAVVRPADLALPLSGTRPDPAATSPGSWLLALFFQRRFAVLVILVICINVAWHFFRAWMPLFLQETHRFGEVEVQIFSSAYYLSTTFGSLAAGFGTLWLAQHGMSVHRSRVMVFGFCALLTTLSLLVGELQSGPMLLTLLLVIGFAALGLYPNYYSFTQELTVRHQGKITGSLGCINWLAMAVLHQQVGASIDETKSYSLGLAVAGIAPMIGFVILVFFWGKDKEREQDADGR